MLLIVVAATIFLAQTPDTSSLQPYLLHKIGAVEPEHVLADPADVNQISFDVLHDEPWTRRERWETVQRITLRPEDGMERDEPALRENWLNTEWPKHGGVQITKKSGERIWILKDEQVWADKAQALARKAYAAPAEPATEPALPKESSSTGPGGAQLWGPHVGVIAGAVALIAAVFFLLLRQPEQWQPLNSGNQAPRKR